MYIKCPHCGKEYEVERRHMYRHTTCSGCGKGFIIGQTAKSEDGESVHQFCKKTDVSALNEEKHNESSPPKISQNPLAIVVGGQLDLKKNLPSWFRMYFCRWRLVHVVCPECKADKVVCAPRRNVCAFRCDDCGAVSDVGRGFAQLQEEYHSSRMACAGIKKQIDQQLAPLRNRLSEVLKQLQTCERIMALRSSFFEQVRLFDCEWDAYVDEFLPKRLKFIIDGLRVRLTNAHSSSVANAVAHAEATNQAFGTTVGLRDPHNNWYGLARDLIQIGGWEKMIASCEERRKLNCSIEGLTSNLDYYETMMTYYYDLCEEFRGKDKETAKRDRLQSRCGYQDIETLPSLNDGINEESLMTEKKTLEKKIKYIQFKSGVQYASLGQQTRQPLCNIYKSKIWVSVLLSLTVVVVLVGCVCYAVARIMI